MHKVNYVEVAMWADELGNTVRRFTPVGTYTSAHGVEHMGVDNPKVVFTGTANIKIQVQGQPPRHQPITFQFPEEVQDVQKAWEMFDKLSDEMLKDMQEQAKAQVIPAHIMPKIVGPDGKPFIGPDGKPIGGRP